VVVLLIITLIVTGDGRAKAETQLDQVKDELKKLQQENQKLNKELIVKNETRKVEKTQVIKPSTNRVVSVSPGKEGIASEIRRTFNSEFAVKVAICESGLNPLAVGSHGERGIFQIHPVHISSLQKVGFTWNDMFDYQKNIQYAKLLYGWQGWSPWSCSRMI